jgi:class 3 adenylate cyclase
MISDSLKRSLLEKYTDERMVKKAFRLPDQLEGFEVARFSPETLAAFRAGTTFMTNLIFTDLCGFSQKVASLSGEQIHGFLDKYYAHAIPTIYGGDGEIEKLIGDGIVAVFGAPFGGDTVPRFQAARDASLALVRSGLDSGHPTKVAFCRGPAFFAHIGTKEYHEPTMVGAVLTDLWRLESVAKDSSVSVYVGTHECKLMDDYYNNLRLPGLKPLRYVASTSIENVSLKGVAHTQVKHFTLRLS